MIFYTPGSIVVGLPTNGKILKKETEMTRVEAIEKLQQKGCVGNENIIDALEAVGLLKFEKEEDTKIIEIRSYGGGCSVYVTVCKAIEALEKAGYKVDKYK